MAIAFIVLMVFVFLVVGFSIVVVIMDLVQENKDRKAAREAAKAAEERAAAIQQSVQEAPVSEPEPEPAPAPVQEEPVVLAVAAEAVAEEVEAEEAEEEQAIALNGNAVTFSSTKDTLEERYLALSEEYKTYYDEISKYAASKEGSKCFKNNRYEEYKLGQTRLVRLLIKRGIVICELIMQNSSFKNYVMENKINVKPAATVIKVLTPLTVQVTKDSIDIIVKMIEEEKENKKQLARERRKARRQQANDATNA